MKRMLTVLAVLSLVLGVVAPTSAQASPTRAAEIRELARGAAVAAREAKEVRIAEIRAEVETRKLTLRQERCEQREARLQTLLPKLTNGATRVKGAIDKVYDRVTGFYASGQLTVQNYEELVAEIELAKANSENALEVLATFQFEFDCESAEVGQQLDAYRTAVNQAKDSLKEYRSAVVELIKGLKSEHARANRTDSGDQTNEEQDNGGQ